MFLQNQILSTNHKVLIQITNMLDPVAHIILQEIWITK